MKTKRIVSIAHITAATLFIGFIPLGWLIYPDASNKFIPLQTFAAIYLFIARWFTLKAKEEHIYPWILISTIVCSITITLVCTVTGGFTSIYCYTFFLVIITLSSFFSFTPKQFNLMMLAMLGQHFIIISILNWDFKFFMVNLSFLGLGAITASVIHWLVYSMTKEIKLLSGLLPICASCKKIRDDKGYWNQIESYIQKHSEALFSHGICPDCIHKLYGDQDWYKDISDETPN